MSRLKIISLFLSSVCLASSGIAQYPAPGTFIDEHPAEETKNLLGFWRFADSTDGTLKDWSYLGGNNPLDLQFVTPRADDLPSEQSWQEGYRGNGTYQFPVAGTGFFLSDLENTTSGFGSNIAERFNLTGNLSIIFHVKFDDFDGEPQWQRIVSTSRRYSDAYGFEVEYDRDTDVLKFNGTGTEQLSLYSENLADGEWHWIAVTLEHSDPLDMNSSLIPLIYIDGVPFDTTHEDLNVFSQVPHRVSEVFNSGVEPGSPDDAYIEENIVSSGLMKALVPYDASLGEKARIAIGNSGHRSDEFDDVDFPIIRQFQGEMSELRIYGSVLSHADILEIMKPEGPYWWYAYGAVDPRLFANDYAPANLGQVKQFASASRDYLDDLLASKRGIESTDSDLESLLEIDSVNTAVGAQVDAFSTDPNVNHMVANIGQAKYLAATQYDFFSELGYTTEWFGQVPFDRTIDTGHSLNYPWTETTADDADSAPISLGQLKYLFNYEFESYLDYDHDNDGISDYVEIYQGGSPSSDLNPDNPDTDGDGMWDGWEVYWNFPYLDPEPSITGGYGRDDDPDNDGLTNVMEAQYSQTGQKLNPFAADTDNDQMWDSFEAEFFLNPTSGQNDTARRDGPNDDLDEDGMTNLEEFYYNNDTGPIYTSYVLDPTDPDSDGDGLPDGWEVGYDLEPSDNEGVNGAAGNPDFDSYTNLEEYLNGTNPRASDDDGLPGLVAYRAPLGFPIAQNSDTDPFSDAQEEILGYDAGVYTEFGDKADGGESPLTPVVLSGQMGVSPNGAATYTLPIDLPPGINNLAPQLSLSYSSQAGDGYVGLGWSLSGLSAVSRGGQTRINDGQFRPVSFSDSDPLYLDGQRLIEIRRHHAGTVREYRTEIDSFSRIASYGHDASGPQIIKVWTKSGLIMEYGATDDAQFIPLGTSAPLAWNLNRVEDTFGNYYTIEYVRFLDTGETYPDRIKYTGNAVAGVETTAEVRFEYMLRKDEMRGYVAGAQMLNRRLLEKIQILSKDEGFRSYTLDYEQSIESRSSRLVSMSVDDFNGYQAIPIAFGYVDDTFRANTNSPQIVSSVAGALDFTDKGNALIPADWDGDGMTDLLTVNEVGSNNISLTVRRFNGTDYSEIIPQPFINSGDLGDYNDTQRWLSGDFDGDGFLDLYQVYVSGEFIRDVRVFLNRGNGEFDSAINVVSDISEYRSNDIYLAVDMDMDGRSDIVRIDDFGGLGVDVWLSDGTANTNNQYSRWGDDLWANGDGTLFGDFNGDGLLDIATIFRNSETFDMESAILINQDDGFVFREIVTYPNASSESKFTVTDLNGDGLSDIVFYEENTLGSVGPDIFGYCQNDGKRFLPERELFVAEPSLLRDELNHFQFADLDGDQIADLVYLDNQRSLKAVYFEQVGNQLNIYKTVEYIGTGISGGDELVNMPFADYDGDGHVDIAIIEGDGLSDPESFRIWPSDGPTNDLLNSVVHGFGLESKVNYGYTIDPEVYQRGTTSTYPRTDLLQPMTVVQSLEMPDGVGGTYTQSYKYACLTSYVDRGLEGFGSYAVTDSRNDQIVVTYHRKGFPFTGAVESSRTYFGGDIVFDDTLGCFEVENGYLLSKEETSGWTVLDYHSGSVTYGYPTTSTSSAYERTGQVLGVEPTPFRTTTTTTALQTFPGNPQETYGDAQTVTIDYGNGRQKVVNNTYQTFANNPPSTYNASITTGNRWQLGRLQGSSVTFEDPVLADVTRETAFTYESLTGALSTETIEPDDPNLAHTTAYTYHWSGQVETATVTANDYIESVGYVSESRTTTTGFSPDGRFPLSVTNDRGHTASRSFNDVSGVVETETDINGLVTTHTYGAFQRLKRTDAPAGDDTSTESWIMSRQEVTTYLSSAAQAIPSGAAYAGVSRSLGLTTDSFTFFDRLGREIATLAYNGDGQLIRTDQEYDARGLLVRQSLPYFYGTQTPEWTQTVYDDIQRVHQQYVPGLGNTFFEYDGLTTVEYRQEAQGTVQLAANYDLVANRAEFIRSATTVDSEDRPVSVEDNENNLLTYLYDGYGNVRRVVRLQGDFIETTYNRRGFRTQIIDPDMGTWTYAYNGFGELVSQTDAKSQSTWMEYDTLGRLVKRRDLEGTTTWTYDTALRWDPVDDPANEPDPDTYNTFQLGSLHEVSTTESGNHTQTYTYDLLGRVHRMTESMEINAETRTFTYDYTFDNYGRSDEMLYPEDLVQVVDDPNTSEDEGVRFRTKTLYSPVYGHPTTVYNVDFPTEVYWRVDDKSDGSGKFDVHGSLHAMTYGSGITTELDFDPTTGFLEFIDTRQAGSSLRSWSYGYNGLGHLTQRGDERGFNETLTYDGLERLQTVSFDDGGSTTDETYSYDLYGNITSRTNLANQAVASNYAYNDSARRNRLTAVDGFGVSYDLNGNITAARGRTIVWNAYNKVEQITQVTRTSQFDYGVDRQRIFQRYDDTSNGDWRETIYSGGGTYEEQTSYKGSTAQTTVIRRVYVSTPVGVIGAFTSRQGMPAKMDYYHYDHQGTIVMTTDDLGNIEESFAYDAWGMRRQAADWERASSIDALFPSGVIDSFRTRGYTGHEMMDAFGLINMNGRIYDPELGRFLSPDPFVQFEGMLQNYNRYSYVLNNPLSYTDPSGYFIDKLVSGIFGAVLNDLIPESIKPYVGLALSFINPYMALGYNIGQGYQNGGVKGAFLAAASAAVSYGIGQGIDNLTGLDSFARASVRALAHGVAQGGLSELGGGEFRSGFLSGAVGSVGGSLAQHYDVGSHVGLAISIVAGGTASELGGGTFANGATSAATIWAFNHMADIRQAEREKEMRANQEWIPRVSIGTGADGGDQLVLSLDQSWLEEQLFGTEHHFFDVTADEFVYSSSHYGLVRWEGGSAQKYTLAGGGSLLRLFRSARVPTKGSTKLGHSWSKKVQGKKLNSAFGKLSGDKSTWHNQAMTHFRDILRGPGNFVKVKNGSGQLRYQKQLADKRGMWVKPDGTFDKFIGL